MQDISTEAKIPDEFLQEIGKQFYKHELIDILGPTLNHFAEDIASIQFHSNSRPVAIRVTAPVPRQTTLFEVGSNER
jgi:hypothetical protein